MDTRETNKEVVSTSSKMESHAVKEFGLLQGGTRMRLHRRSLGALTAALLVQARFGGDIKAQDATPALAPIFLKLPW
jgi:hypothetical protein